MNFIKVVLLLILVFIVASVIATGIHYQEQGAMYTVRPVGEVSKPLVIGEGESEEAIPLEEVAGGADNDKQVDVVLEKMRPYLKEVGESAPVIDYLVSYFDYPAKRTQALDKDSRSNRRAPDKYKFLHTVIADIMYRYDIGSAEDFFKKTALTYSCLVPKERRCLLLEAPVVASISNTDRKKVKGLLDDYLSDAGHYLTKTRLNKQVDEFLQFNRLFKYKSDKVDWPLDKLKKLAAKSPDKVFEVDLLGLRAPAWDWARAHGTGDKDTRLIRQLKRDIEKLKLLRDYPTLYISDVRTVDELAARLQLAAEGLTGRRSRSSFLSDLERERADLRRIAAERREREERGRRQAAEQGRAVLAREKAAQETERLRTEQTREREEESRAASTAKSASAMSERELIEEAKRYSLQRPGMEIDSATWVEMRRSGVSPETIIGLWEEAIAGGGDFYLAVRAFMEDVKKDNINVQLPEVIGN